MELKRGHLFSMKSYWFKRLERELPKIDSRLRLVKLKLGFYRIYRGAHFIGEAYEELGPNWREIESYDPRLENQSYYEEYEDHVKMVRTLKNFMEGYYDLVSKIRRCVYQLRHNEEFARRSGNIYNNAESFK